MFGFLLGVVVGGIGLTAAVALYAPAETLFDSVVSWARNKFSGSE